MEQDYIDIVAPDDHLDSNYTLVTHHVMSQFSMKVDLNKFNERDKKVLTTELSQLHFCNTFEPVDPKKLNRQLYCLILEPHLFLKEKCDATIKGCMVAGGN